MRPSSSCPDINGPAKMPWWFLGGGMPRWLTARPCPIEEWYPRFQGWDWGGLGLTGSTGSRHSRTLALSAVSSSHHAQLCPHPTLSLSRQGGFCGSHDPVLLALHRKVSFGGPPQEQAGNTDYGLRRYLNLIDTFDSSRFSLPPSPIKGLFPPNPILIPALPLRISLHVSLFRKKEPSPLAGNEYKKDY